MDADRSDVQPLRRARHRARGNRCPRGRGRAHVPGGGEPRPGAMGAARTSSIPGARCSPTWASAPAPTSASVRTWPAPSSSPRSVRCSTGSRTCASIPTPRPRASPACTNGADLGARPVLGRSLRRRTHWHGLSDRERRGAMASSSSSSTSSVREAPRNHTNRAPISEQAHAHEHRVAHAGGERLACRVGERGRRRARVPRAAPRWPGASRACCATSPGRPVRWPSIELRYPVLNALPSTATPNAAPSSRDVSFTADATPCLARGSDATIALVAGVIASAAPTPITMVTNMNAKNPLPVPRVANSAEADRRHREADAADEPVPVLLRHRPGHRGDGQDHDAHRQQRERGLERAVAEHELQELERHEEEAEHGEELQEQRRRSGREAAVGEQARVEQRFVGAELDPDEPDEEDDATDQADERERVRPARARGLR